MSASDTATGEVAPTDNAELRDEVRTWLGENWNPELTVGQWWELLGLAGWVAPAWPSDWFGRDLSTAEANVVSSEIAEFGALGAPGGLGLLLAGPECLGLEPATPHGPPALGGPSSLEPG